VYIENTRARADWFLFTNERTLWFRNGKIIDVARNKMKTNRIAVDKYKSVLQ